MRKLLFLPCKTNLCDARYPPDRNCRKCIDYFINPVFIIGDLSNNYPDLSLHLFIGTACIN